MKRLPFFEHASSGVRVRFRHEEYDWLILKLGWSGNRTRWPDADDPYWGREDRGLPRLSTVSVPLSSTICPFPQFIAWLEAMALGCNECGFRWDCEGPTGWLRWLDGVLEIEWSGRSRYPAFRHHIEADRRQVVGAFYQAFRGFVNSSEYRPQDYESMSCGDFLVLRTGFTPDELVGQLLGLDAATAACWLKALSEYDASVAVDTTPSPGLSKLLELFKQVTAHIPDETEREHRHYLLPKPWNRWSIAERRTWLRWRFAQSSGSAGWFGGNLRAMRSKIVEEFLGWRHAAEREACLGFARNGPSPFGARPIPPFPLAGAAALNTGDLS